MVVWWCPLLWWSGGAAVVVWWCPLLWWSGGAAVVVWWCPLLWWSGGAAVVVWWCPLLWLVVWSTPCLLPMWSVQCEPWSVRNRYVAKRPRVLSVWVWGRGHFCVHVRKWGGVQGCSFAVMHVVMDSVAVMNGSLICDFNHCAITT